MLAKIVLLGILLGCCQACTPQAPATESQRTVYVSGATLIYSPASLVTETPLSLGVQAPANWRLQSAKMTGISMEMPVMPLFFTQNAGTDASHSEWQTQFLVGVCADAKMTWRLELVFLDQSGAEQRLTDEFQVFRR